MASTPASRAWIKVEILFLQVFIYVMIGLTLAEALEKQWQPKVKQLSSFFSSGFPALRVCIMDITLILDICLAFVWHPYYKHLGSLNTLGWILCASPILASCLRNIWRTRGWSLNDVYRLFRRDTWMAKSEPEMNKTAIPPLLIPARTTHSRFSPKKHSFSYSYFYVGIPVGWRGRAGSTLSADVGLVPYSLFRKYGWFDVNSADYLSRDPTVIGLEAKLRDYLRSEGVSDDSWSFAYLCTAPRFLGYSFNPVSFWYIYNASSELVMMVLEVNNTFDERRVYLLRANESLIPDDDHALSKKRFKQSWPKDFHVSPFNSRKGSYSLQAADILGLGSDDHALLDNTITLRSSKGEIKLVARVFSEGAPIDPSSVGTMQLLRFVGQWCLVGFVTAPRILYEAFRLFFIRKLHVWYRPEVTASSIGRRATKDEHRLEGFFSDYLQHQVQECPVPVAVTYTPPSDIGQPKTWTSKTDGELAKDTRQLNVHVRTPVFYSRFVHYLHTKEALDREFLCTSDKNQTIFVSDPELLDLITKREVKQQEFTSWTARLLVMPRLHRFKWYLVQCLRCPPPLMSYEEGTPKASTIVKVIDIRPGGLSPLDRYVANHHTAVNRRAYQRIALKQFLTQRYAFGWSPLLKLADWAIRFLLILIPFYTEMLLRSAVRHNAGLLDHRQFMIGATLADLVAGNLIHVWSFVKSDFYD